MAEWRRLLATRCHLSKGSISVAAGEQLLQAAKNNYGYAEFDQYGGESVEMGAKIW